MNAVSPEVQSHQAIRAKPLAVTFVDHLAGLDAMRDAWTSLIEAQSADEPLFFQSFEWCRHIAGVRHGPKSWRLAVAFVRSGDDLVGIWPLSVQLRAGARQVRSLDDPFGQFASIICAPELTHQCVLAILNGLRSAGIGDLITIEKVISGSQLDRALKAQGSRASLSGHSVVLNAGAFVDYADYHAKLNRKTAKNLRNAMNRLTRLGEVRSEVVTDPFEVANLIQSTFDGRLAWMKAYGKTAPAFREPDYEEIINSLGISAKEIGLIGFTLTSAGTKIAEQWGFIHRNTYYAYISSRDLAMQELSAGRLHLGLVIKACFEMNVQRLELMSPASDYKLSWSRDTKQIDDHTLSLNIKGKAHLAVWTRTLRPLIKSTYHALPQSVRGWLTGHRADQSPAASGTGAAR